MATGILRVQRERIVDENGTSVILRGAALGGWMNMENFITGFPGQESEHRAAMLEVLGKEKYEFFFDKWLEYFFTEDDAAFFASLGLNCLRLPFNYKHLEDDMNPRVLKEEGFKHLDRVINLCAKYKIYTILDMHTVPGAQNPDWHSDNSTAHAAFWDHKDHQDRCIWLWSQLAARYKDYSWVAGYNPINEPCDPEHTRLPAFYARFARAIRAIDDKHIFWLDGNTFAMEWKGFGSLVSGPDKLENCAYSLHDYAGMGFPGREQFTGSEEQKRSLERQFLRKAEFMQHNKVPAWNGEFGPVYEPSTSPDASSINSARYALLGAQLELYAQYSTPWSIWLYKDIGLQGMLTISPDSAYGRAIAPFAAKKATVPIDAWGVRPNPTVDTLLDPLVAWIDSVAPEAKDLYPGPWNTKRHVMRAVLQTYVSRALQGEFARSFANLSFEELEECARSFAYKNCVKREGLNEILRKHALGK